MTKGNVVSAISTNEVKLVSHISNGLRLLVNIVYVFLIERALNIIIKTVT
jgi:hypothetical protein